MRHDDGLEIRLLGPLEVIMTGRPIVVDTRKALAIVALVATEQRPFARDELAAMFWAEADDEAANGALRRTLSTLRAALGGRGLIIERSRVLLEPAVSVDLAEIERLATSTVRSDLERAASLARGPFLAGFALRGSPAFDDWHAARAVRAERVVADVLDRLAVARLAAGDLSGAIDAAGRRVDLDPLDESGHRQLMDLLARSGDRSAAIRQYRSLVAIFDRELGVAPLQETTDRYEAIRDAGRGASAAEAVVVVGATPAAVVVGATPIRSLPDPGSGPSAVTLFGRDPEWHALLDAWRGARPDGRVVAIEGEAGIGKTRLGDAVAEAVRAAGGTVLAARAFPGETGIAYGPIVELLRAGSAIPGGVERLAGLTEATRREIGRLVDLPPGLRAAGRPAPDGTGARIRLLAAVGDALTGLAGAAGTAGAVPGMLWIDDLHLADDPTREALVYLAHRLVGRSTLVLLAWRREDLSTAALAATDDLARMPSTLVLRLGRLDRAAVTRIMQAGARGALDPGAVDAILAESEGLPLHVVEALHASDPGGVGGGGGGAAGSGGGGVPGGVQALLLERICSVGQTAGQVLAAASVIGRSFDLETVRQASGRSAEETVDALEELMRRGLVRELPPAGLGPIRYDFSHGRLRDVAYESTSLARRRLLHGRIADALRLDLDGTRGDDPTRVARIAAHERDAGRAAQAALAFVDAADRAEAVFANREAIEHLEAALALGGGKVSHLHARIGRLWARLGSYVSAIAALETAAALADPDELGRIEVALGRVHLRRGDLATAASHLDAALALPALEPAIHVEALVERSVVALRGADLAGAGAMAEAARALAATAGDAHELGIVERLTGLVAQAGGDLDLAEAAFERSVALAADDADPTAAIAARTALALVQAAAGRVDEAVATGERAIEECRRIGDRHLEAAVENHLADLLHAAGRADASMDHLKRAVAIFAEIGDGTADPDPGIWSLSAW